MFLCFLLIYSIFVVGGEFVKVLLVFDFINSLLILFRLYVCRLCFLWMCKVLLLVVWFLGNLKLLLFDIIMYLFEVFLLFGLLILFLLFRLLIFDWEFVLVFFKYFKFNINVFVIVVVYIFFCFFIIYICYKFIFNYNLFGLIF